MRNWFLEKSMAVRAAIIVLAAAVVTAIGAGVYMIVNHATSNREVAEIEDNTNQPVSPVITEEPEVEVIDAEDDNTTTDVAVLDNKETEAPELMDVYYQKTSNRLENGDFSDGLNAWEVYSFVNDNIDYTADDYFSITMQETGTEDWHVQLKQTGIRLEKGKWYTISFDAKSTLGRSITCAMQRDGMIHNDDWTPYANAKAYTLTSNWKTFTYTFQMNENTDNASVFMLSLGAINGRRLTTEHTICVDNIKLTQLADNWTDALKVGDNLIGNADFSYESTLWDASVVAPGAAQVSFDGNKATFDISNVGTVDWHVQLKQGAIKLANNQGYRLTFTVSSTTARTIKIGFMDTEYVNWYGGGDVVLNGTENQEVTVDFYNSIGANNNALFMLSMGKIEGVSTPAGKITLSNFKLVKCDSVSASAGGYGGGWTDPNHNLPGGWVVYDHESSHTNAIYESNGVYNISITNTGSEDWHVQMKNSNISLENGKWYKMSYEVKSSIARNIGVNIMRDGSNDDNWSSYSTGSNVKAVGTDWTLFETTFQMTSESDAHAIYNFALGKVNGQGVSGTHLVSIRNISVVETTEPVVQDRDIAVGDEVLANGGAISAQTWSSQVAGTAQGTIDIVNGKYVANISDYGTDTWHSQISQAGLKIEKGATYEVKFTAVASVARNIAVDILSPDRNYDWIGGINLVIGANGTAAQDYSFTFTSSKDTDRNAALTFSLGAMDGAANGIFEFYNISVKKTAEPSSTPKVTPNAEHKGEFVINPADYGITNPVGKHIKVTAKAKSTGKIEGGVGGNSSVTNAWADGGYFVSETGAEVAISYTLEGYKDFMKIDFYYIAADVEIYDVVVTDVTPVAGQIVSPNAEHKGEFVINPADYGITNPVGKHIKVTAKAKSTGKIEGGVGGNSSVTNAWADGGYFVSETGAEVAISYTLEGYKDFMKIDFYYIAADVEIYDVVVTDVTPAAPQIVSPNAGNKGEFVIDPANYGITSPAGKHIKVTAKLKSTGKIEGAIGGNSSVSGTWAQSAGFASETGSEITVSYTLEGYVDSLKIDFWYIQADVEVYDVTVEDVTPAAPQIVSPNAGNKGEFVIDPANYGITSPAGKHIKVTAKLKSTGKIEGAIGGNSSVSGTWAQSAGFASETGSEITVSYTLEGYVDFLKIDFWYIQADVEVYAVTVEDVTPAVLGVALGEDPVVGVAAEENDEAVIAEAEDIIADPEDVLSEPEDFVVDGDTAIDNDDAEEDSDTEFEEAEEVEEAEELVFVDLNV